MTPRPGHVGRAPIAEGLTDAPSTIAVAKGLTGSERAEGTMEVDKKGARDDLEIDFWGKAVRSGGAA